MKMRFGHVALIYGILWIFVIVGVCTYVWNGLEGFQHSYDDSNNLLEIKGEMQNVSNTVSVDGNRQEETKPQVIANKIEIISDSTFTVYVNGSQVTPEDIELVEDELLSDYNELTGVSRNIYTCKVAADKLTDIVVRDKDREEIFPVDNDFVKGQFVQDEALTAAVLYDFEAYLKHISGLVSLEDLQSVMRTDSKAYKAVKASQQSLEWMIKAKEMTFARESVTDIWYLDRDHVICNIEIDLTKITENDRTVNETVDYRVLMENIGGYWKIYSFGVN